MNFNLLIDNLQVEPFGFLFALANSLEKLTIIQLVQDKICLFKYNKSIEYCTVLGSSDDQDDVDFAQFDHRSVILNDVKLFRLLILSINTLSLLFWSLFIGSWADRKPSSRKFILFMSSLAGLIQTIVICVNAFLFHLGLYFSHLKKRFLNYGNFKIDFLIK